jgi:hypothetical protein
MVPSLSRSHNPQPLTALTTHNRQQQRRPDSRSILLASSSKGRSAAGLISHRQTSSPTWKDGSTSLWCNNAIIIDRRKHLSMSIGLEQARKHVLFQTAWLPNWHVLELSVGKCWSKLHTFGQTEERHRQLLLGQAQQDVVKTTRSFSLIVLECSTSHLEKTEHV